MHHPQLQEKGMSKNGWYKLESRFERNCQVLETDLQFQYIENHSPDFKLTHNDANKERDCASK